MSKGIVLLAMGNPNYGAMAFNLAVSIKNMEPDIPIAIIHDGKALSRLSFQPLDKVFSHKIEAPMCSYISNGTPSYFKAKLFVYELSPFDETIYLDADTLWLYKKPSTLFNDFKDIGFTAISEGYYDMAIGENKINLQYPLWGDLDQIKKAYNSESFNTGKLYQFRSEFMYFKKSEKNKQFFDLAKEIYDNPKVELTKVGKSIPDEFSMNVAGCLLHHYPHEDNYCPVYWYFTKPRQWNDKKKINDNYYAISMGGNSHASFVKEYVNRLVKAAFQRAGIKYPYLYQDKRSWLPERKNI